MIKLIEIPCINKVTLSHLNLQASRVGVGEGGVGVSECPPGASNFTYLLTWLPNFLKKTYNSPSIISEIHVNPFKGALSLYFSITLIFAHEYWFNFVTEVCYYTVNVYYRLLLCC